MSWLTNLLKSKEAVAREKLEKQMEKQDRSALLAGMARIMALAENLEKSQGVVSDEIKKIENHQSELQRIFQTMNIVVKTDFYFRPKKKNGYIRIKVSPQEFLDKFHELLIAGRGKAVSKPMPLIGEMKSGGTTGQGDPVPSNLTNAGVC